ncbi:MAG: Fungal specific transcription factor [Stictis urceolatum]|nr:Fungal specific transcription factor [Stictis urceolata]
MAAAVVVAQHHHPAISGDTPELRKKLSPGELRANQKPMSSTPINKTPAKPVPIPRGKRERPCDACRRRKSKCVVTEGSKICAACGVHEQECTYVEDPQPRKRKVEGDAQGAESKRRSQVSPMSDVSSTPSFVHQGSAPIQPSRTCASVIPKQIVSMPSISIQASASHYSGIYVGPTTELEPLLLNLSSTSTSLSSTYHTFSSTPFLLMPTPSTKSIDTAHSTLAAITGPYGSLFLHIYLNHIHPVTPLLPSSFFTSASTSPASLSAILLSAVYTSTLPFLSSASFPCSDRAPNILALEQLAFTLFSESLLQPTLDTIQAGILLIQRPGIDTRALNIQLVAAAYDLGLHIDPSHWNLPNDEVGLRKRLAWAVYILDKWSSLSSGRPSLIRSEEWGVSPLSLQNFDSTSPQPTKDSTTEAQVNEELDRGKEVFIELVRLSEILATVLDTFYTLRAMDSVERAGRAGTRVVLERAKPVQIRLKEWFGGLRVGLRMDSLSTSAGAGSCAAGHGAMGGAGGVGGAVAHLHLAYFATEISLHRCIIRSLHLPTPSPSNPSTSPSTLNAPQTEPQSSDADPDPDLDLILLPTPRQDPLLTHICRSAAKTRLISTMDFINRLRPGHYHSLSLFFAAPMCFSLVGSFGALLRATAPAREEEEFYARRLGEYRWTLAVSASAGVSVTARDQGEGERDGEGEGEGEGEGDWDGDGDGESERDGEGERSREDGRDGAAWKGTGGAEWLREAVAWVDVLEEVCRGVAAKEAADRARSYADTEDGAVGAGERRNRNGRITPGEGSSADGGIPGVAGLSIDGVQAVRFAQIGEGETALASRSVSTESGGSFEA